MGNCHSSNKIKKKVHNLYYLDNPLNLYCFVCYQQIERSDTIHYTTCCFRPTHINCVKIINKSFICPNCKLGNQTEKKDI